MKKVAIFMLFGQSNAVGHAMPMNEEDIIKEPLKNVFGLNREPNQSYDTEKLKFTGYTSFGMNLAETQDNTYSIANCLAKRWQNDIDSGVELPDLYIIHIAIGSQGVTGMWDPKRAPKMIRGKLGDCDISMYPLAIHVLTLFKKYMEANELEPDYVGIHWRGGEQETDYPVSKLETFLKDTYLEIFGGIRSAIGCDAPVVFHRFPFNKVFANRDKEDGGTRLQSMHYINDTFDTLAKEMTNASVYDVRTCPLYDEYAWDCNIFRWDLIHYQGRVNDYVAGEILKEYKDRK